MRYNTISDRIVAVRGRDSRACFAARIDINAGTLRNYEGGLSLPNADVLARICRVCGINPRWLLTGEGPMRVRAELSAPAQEEEFPESVGEDGRTQEQLRVLREKIGMQKETIEAQKKTIRTYETLLAALQADDGDAPSLGARCREALRAGFREASGGSGGSPAGA